MDSDRFASGSSIVFALIPRGIVYQRKIWCPHCGNLRTLRIENNAAPKEDNM